jgi:hypothetical protein
MILTHVNRSRKSLSLNYSLMRTKEDLSRNGVSIGNPTNIEMG